MYKFTIKDVSLIKRFVCGVVVGGEVEKGREEVLLSCNDVLAILLYTYTIRYVLFNLKGNGGL
jgi:hypothetical protein